ncbi:MAG: YggT family protein [Deltaproteobacteria bacterium]|nr:YggT family protein [Deltaproteobacteria bacterium]
MFVVGNFLDALASVVDYALHLYMWVIIVRALLSWVSPDPYNPIVRFIHNVTEPVLFWVRRQLRLGYGGIDFSPILVILAIWFLRIFVVGTLRGFASRMY